MERKRQKKCGSMRLRVRIIGFLLLCLPGLMNMAFPSTCAAHEKMAVILSPGPQQGVPWGGYHVTVTGYSDRHACIQNNSCGSVLAHEFKSVFHGKPWRLHGDLPLMKKDPHLARWIQKFESHTLSELAKKLEHAGFDKIKGPAHSGMAWHVTLDHDFSSSRAKIEELKHHKVDWHLWLVPEPGSACRDKGIDCRPDRWRRIH